MPFQQIRQNRNNYAYSAVALNGNFNALNVRHFGTTTALDDYISGLLNAQDINSKILGYLSVVFWGFYSGQDGVIRESRALGKTSLAYNGRDRVVGGCLQRLRGVVDHGCDTVANHIN